jgi:hypothetical protein
MATLGNTIGGTFLDLAEIINLVKDKSRVGVCLDTCHVFAAGYYLRSPKFLGESLPWLFHVSSHIANLAKGLRCSTKYIEATSGAEFATHLVFFVDYR